MSFPEAYKLFWKKTADYSSCSGRREYWLPVGFHLILTLITVIYYVVAKNNDLSSIPFWILLVYLIATLPSFTALSVRRLKDTGMSGLWALLLLFAGAGTCVVLCLCAAGSSFLPWNNRPESLYGPPPFESAEIDPSNISPVFDPSRNEPVDVYGPPEWFTKQAPESGSERK